MKKNKLVFAMLLCIALIMAMIPGATTIRAEEGADGAVKNYNIELVVDASGSLNETDIENNRYTAIDIFLQSLREKGNNVGTVVFTSQIEKDTGLSEMNSKNSKESLGKQIKEYVPDRGDTNIGLALQTAINNLKNYNNDSENIILLLSDGNTDLGSEQANAEALAIEHKSIEQCISENIKIYGICLNSDGNANLKEFKDMTAATSGAFLEVRNSENLVAALKDFYGQIFQTKFISDTTTIINGVASKSIEVPSYGVSELNITIDNASKLSNVTITKPNGVDISANEFAGISSVIGDYYFIKISEPDAGLWRVTVKGEEGTNITFDFVFNADNKVMLETTSKDKSFSLGEEVEFTTGFYSNGNKLVGKEYYEYYKGTLVVNFANSENKNAQYYPMEPDGDNGFKTSLSYDSEGTYEIYSVLTCGEFESLSAPIVLSVGDSLPKFSADDKTVTINIMKLFNKSKTIDIGKYFSDKEDKKLSFKIIASSYEDDEIDGPDEDEIVLNKLVSGKMTIQAEDSNGGIAKGVIEIKVQNLGLIIIFVIGFIILFIIIIMIYKKIEDSNQFFAGYLNVYSNSQVDDSRANPASNFVGKYEFDNFGLMNHQFGNGMYFKVLKDKSISGRGSRKLRLISPKAFYYLSPSGEQKVKTLDMCTGMSYTIRSNSQEDPMAYNDSISITLGEV